MKHIEDLTKEDLGFFHVCLSCLHIALLVYYSNRFLKIVKGNDLLPF
jgi:hypothetical protein